MANDPGGRKPRSSQTPDSAPTPAGCETVLAAVDEGVFRLDRDGTFVGVDEVVADLTGHARKELVGAHLASVVADGDAARRAIDDLLADPDGVETVSATVQGPDGETTQRELRMGLPEADGSPVGVIRSVDESKHRRRDLRSMEREFHSLVENVEEYAIFTLDPDGTIASWNLGAERIKGYEEEEIVGEHFSTFYTDEDVEAGVPERNLTDAREEGSVEDEGWRVREDDTTFWANVVITAVRDDDGDLQGFVKVTRDMTERKQAEQALTEERDLLERVMEAAPVAISVLTPDGEVERANERALSLRGLAAPGSDQLASPDRTLYDEDGRPIDLSEERPHALVMETGEPVRDWVAQLELPDGSRKWLSVNAAPIFNDDGEIERIVTVAEEITRLKEQARRLERKRDELETELDGVFDRVDDAFYALDGEWRFTYVNDRAEEIIERSEAELLGESVWEAFPEAADGVVWEKYHEAMETQEPVSFELFYDPLDVWVEINAYPSETGVSVYFRDITERKERERALEESEARYRSLTDDVLDTSEVGTFILDSNFDVVWANEAVESYFGLDREEIVGRDKRRLVRGRIAEIFEEPDRFADRVTATYRDNTYTEEFECHVLGGEGREERWLRHWSQPIESGLYAGGRIEHYTDVTERVERERQLEQFERIVETVDDGIYVLDGSKRFRRVNDTFVSMTRFDRSELLDTHASMVFGEGFDDLDAEARRQFDAGEADVATFEEEIYPAEGDAITVESRFRQFEIEDGQGRVGVVRDVTSRKRFEETLTALYDAAQDLLSAETKEEVGEITVETVTDVLDISGVVAYLYDEEDDRLYPAARSVESGFMREEFPEIPPGDASITGHVYAAGESRQLDDVTDSPYLQADATEMRAGIFAPMGDHGVLVVGSREVGALDERTRRLVELLAANAQAAHDRVERERQLEDRARQQEVVAELGQRALENLRLDDLFAETTERVAETLGHDYCKVLDLSPEDDELLLRAGVGWKDGYVGETTVGTGRDSQAGYTLHSEDPVTVNDLDAETRFSGPELLTEHDVGSGISTIIGSVDDPWGVLGTHDRDTGEFDRHETDFVQSVATILATAIQRRTNRRELKRFEVLMEESTDLNAILDPDGTLRYLTPSVERILGYDREELVGENAFEYIHPEDRERMMEALARLGEGGNDEEEENTSIEFRFEAADGSWVWLEAQGRNLLSDPLIGGIVAYTRDVTARREYERMLETQRARLSSLNQLNDVVNKTTHAVVEAETREEIEEAVCEELASTGGFEFAWIGEIDSSGDTVRVRTEAGVEGYLDDVEITVDGDDGVGPTGRAIRTGEPRVSKNVLEDPDYEQWRDRAREYGYRSSAAIPITYEDAMYGVLNVYSARPGAFDEEATDIVSGLGEVVGHAIAAFERKRALTSDEVIEVEFRLRDFFDEIDLDPEARADETVLIERVIPTDEDSYLAYGAVAQEAVDTLYAIAERIPDWNQVKIISEGSDTSRFELELSGSPAVAAAVAQGGHVTAAKIEDGDYDMTVHLPIGSDVRAVVESLEETYPAVELITQRRTTRVGQSVQDLYETIEDELTLRQRTVLETAYSAGFFEWPRDSTGEEVAESLGVSPPTFHQHLRTGERKLLEAVFDDRPLKVPN